MSKSISKLKEAAKKNVIATKKSYDSGSEPIISGSPLDHTVKHEPYDGAKVGMSKGITKNMDNYESLRVDVWVTDKVEQGETIEEAYTRISAVLSEVLEQTVAEITEE